MSGSTYRPLSPSCSTPRLLVVCAAVTLALIAPAPSSAAVGDVPIPGLPETPTYVVHRTRAPIVVDGRLDDAAWQLAPRTDSWRWLDTTEPARLETYGQMAWDDEYFYFAFSSEDPDIWSTMQIRDEPIYIQEDFEIFLDPDGDEFHYYEWQINPLGTLYDVIWRWPNHTPGPGNVGDIPWDLTPMLSGHQVRGTVWERADVDTGWTAEVALSWEGLRRIPGRFRSPPQPGDTWRIGFSRVESPEPPYWQADWTWPTHGEYNMHIGGRDAFVQFTDAELGPRPAAFRNVPRLRGAEVRLEPEAAGGGIEPGRLVKVVPRIANDGGAARQVEARLATIDSLVTVLDSTATVGAIPAGGSRWADDGFVVRLSRAAEPGRMLVFQLAMVDADGRWAGESFFSFAAGRAWTTAVQVREGVQYLRADDDGIWAVSRANVWHWDADGRTRGFYQADDGLPRHARLLEKDERGRIWAAGERGVACFEDGRWRELTGQQGMPPRGFEALAAAPGGDMWIASRDGLYRFGDRVRGAWTAAEGYVPGKVRGALVDHSGAAWVVGDSLVFHVDGDGARLLGARHGMPSDHLTCLTMDPAGQVWVGGVRTAPPYRDGGVGRFDGTSWQVWRARDGLAQDSVSVLYADRAGRIWAGHPDGALSVFDGTAWDHWPAGSGPGCAPPCGTWVGGRAGFVDDDQGNVWIVGTQALGQWDGRCWQTWTWRNGLLGGQALAVGRGPDGRVYVGDPRSLSYFGARQR